MLNVHPAGVISRWKTAEISPVVFLNIPVEKQEKLNYMMNNWLLWDVYKCRMSNQKLQLKGYMLYKLIFL